MIRLQNSKLSTKKMVTVKFPATKETRLYEWLSKQKQRLHGVLAALNKQQIKKLKIGVRQLLY